MNLEQKLKEAEALVAAVRKQIEEEKELKPYDWNCKERYYVGGNGRVDYVGNGRGASGLFYKKTKTHAKAFAHRLKILSCINNLKETLGCDWEFNHTEMNYYVYWSSTNQKWFNGKASYEDRGIIYFKSLVDCQEVAKYLNKHYPNGWRLA
jgi:hypothetical protein